MILNYRLLISKTISIEECITLLLKHPLFSTLMSDLYQIPRSILTDVYGDMKYKLQTLY